MLISQEWQLHCQGSLSDAARHWWNRINNEYKLNSAPHDTESEQNCTDSQLHRFRINEQNNMLA